MAETCLRVARAILLHSPVDPLDRRERQWLLREAGGVADASFRDSGNELGAKTNNPGRRFFDTTVRGKLAFGPGAGLAIGVSVGTESLRGLLVDANGWSYHETEGASEPKQLEQSPEVLLERIRAIVSDVVSKGRIDDRLLVDGKLPLLGCAVAWPSPITRSFYPHGQALAHDDWRGGAPLDQRVARLLELGDIPSYALNDAHAAAIAVAFLQTHNPDALNWDHSRLSVIVRIAGGIGGGIMVFERPRTLPGGERESGFLRSILLDGFDNFAGEIGHVPIHQDVIDTRNADLPSGLSELRAISCSCSRSTSRVPSHLEAYASGKAAAARLNRREPMHKVLRRLLDSPEESRHARVLADVGVLVGEALAESATLLNPASITLTGALAIEPVRAEVSRRLASDHRFGHEPQVILLPPDLNKYIRARGAALALMRNRVHRQLPVIFGDNEFGALNRIKGLTTYV